MPAARLRTEFQSLTSRFSRTSGNAATSSSNSGTGSRPPIRAAATSAAVSSEIRPTAVGHPVQGVVVEKHQDAVGRGVHIRFEVPVAEVDGGAERGHRVFQPLAREAAVGHGHGTAGAKHRRNVSK